MGRMQEKKRARRTFKVNYENEGGEGNEWKKGRKISKNIVREKGKVKTIGETQLKMKRGKK